MNNCIFCKIVNNEIPSQKVFENDEVVAFLDIQPVRFGHTLVIPKKHYDNFMSTPLEVVSDIFSVVHKLANDITKAMKADGFNLSLNNGKAAGQVVDHTHVHIIPRYNDDGLKAWDKLIYQDKQMSELAEQIRGVINNN